MSLQEVMDPQGADWQWDGQAWILRQIHLPPRPRPPFPPVCPPFPPRPINGPIAGVTDGSAARPGEVGEFLMGTASVNLAINPSYQTLLAQPLVLPPGDWDVEAQIYAPMLVSEALVIQLSPVPPGVSPQLQAYAAAINSTAEFQGILTTNRSQALVAVPTLLPFQVIAFNASTTSSANLIVTARRMR